MPFTDKQVAALRPRSKRYEKAEPGRTGLRLRVGPAGGKSWTFAYKWRGEAKRLLLGHYPGMGLADAHMALADVKAKLKAGTDPGIQIAAERDAELNAETFDELAEEYIARHAAKMKTGHQDELLLKAEVIPTWRSRKAREITRRDIIKLLDRLEDRGVLVQRNRLAGLLSRVFAFALDRGIVDASPAAGVKRLPEKSRARFLTVEEIRTLWQGLESPELKMIPAVRLAVKFLIATGQRRSEVAGIERSEIDDIQAVWRLPAARAKNGREHIIPLPPLAMHLVAEADKLRVRSEPVRAKRSGRPAYDPEPSPFLFPSWRLGRPLNADALTRGLNNNRAALGLEVMDDVALKAGDSARVHDLRRTFATWHGELGTAPEVLSALLNHAPTHITASVYNRASLLEPRRRAMEVWCAWLERVVSGQPIAENVVRLERRW